jgi:glycosyltransferase EpsD
VFAAEYAKGKDQMTLLEAVGLLKKTIPDILLLLPGDGPLRQQYEQAIETLGIQKNVWLMGYRNDMDQLLLAADVAVSSSLREGMGINLVEAMAVTLPVVASRIRGHADLIVDGQNGFLVAPRNAQAMADRLAFLYENPDARHSMREKTRALVKPFLLQNARTATTDIYDLVIGKINAAKIPVSRKLSKS